MDFCHSDIHYLLRVVLRLHIPTPLELPPLNLLRCTSEGNVTSHHFLQYYMTSLCLTWYQQVIKVLFQNVCNLVFLKKLFLLENIS